MTKIKRRLTTSSPAKDPSPLSKNVLTREESDNLKLEIREEELTEQQV
jgi:hypothetical protein